MNSDVAFSMVAALVVQQHGEFIKGRVLDVGCGGKPYKRLFHDPMEKKYADGVTEWVGLDVRPVGEVVADARSMPLEDESFDTVLCVDTLSYIFEASTAFSEMVRVLKKGGHIILVEPNNREDDSDAFWGFRTRSLGAFAQSSGMEVLELMAASKLWTGEFENLRGQTKWSFMLPGELQGFIEALETKYPNISLMVARK